jgi:hypothetical protein
VYYGVLPVGLAPENRVGLVFIRPLTDLSAGFGSAEVEFERRVQKLAKVKELSCFFVADKGKG